MNYTKHAKLTMALGVLLSAIPWIGSAQTVLYTDSFESDALNSKSPAGWTDVATGISPGGGYACVQAAGYSGNYSGLNGVHAVYLFLQGLSGQTATSQGNRFYNSNIGQTYAADTTYKLTYLYGVNGGGPTAISLMGNNSVITASKQTITGGSTALVSGPIVTVDTTANPGLVGQNIGIDINWSPYTGQYFKSVMVDNIQVTATSNVITGKNSMGINLGNQTVFVDLIKNLRQGAFLAPALVKVNGVFPVATLDANGWPSQDFAVGVCGTGHAHAVTNSVDYDIGGTYAISFQCANNSPVLAGTPFPFTVTGFSAVADGTGQYLITANLNLPSQPLRADGLSSNALWIKITNTTQGAISGVRNLKVILPGYPANTTQLFRSDYLSMLAPFSVMRTMDWTATNECPAYPGVTAWTDRTPPTFATIRGRALPNAGIPWEHVILLANMVNKDPWINVPIAATDDYVTKLAKLFKYGSDAAGNIYTSTQTNPVNPPLNANLHLYVEYSNEVWNGSFAQAAWNVTAAQTEYTNGTSPVTASANLKPLGSSDFANATRPGPANRVAERLVQISNIFSSVWGAGAINTTIRPVYAWQLGGGNEDQCAWIQTNYGAPKNYIYALAAAPYLGTARVHSIPDVTPALTAAECITDMESSLVTQYPYMINLRAGATYYGLKDVLYEGGVGITGDGDFQAKYDSGYLVGINGGQHGVDTLLKSYFNTYFTTEGGDLSVYYSSNYVWGIYGHWGFVEHPQDVTLAGRPLPKWTAINAVSAAPRPASTAGSAVPAAGVRINVAEYLISLNSLQTTQYIPNGIYNSTDTPSAHYILNFGPNLTTDAAKVREYLVNVSTAGTYTIKQSYGSTNPSTATPATDASSGPAVVQLWVDNQQFPSVSLPPTVAYSKQFVDVALGTLALTKGLHTIHVNVIHGGNSGHSQALGLSELVITP